LGMVIALVLEFLDNTVKTTEDVGRVLNLPTLAVIPSIASKKSRLLLGVRKSNDLALTVRGNGSANLVSQADISEMLAGKGQTALAEAYRGLRTSVLLSTAGSPPKTVLFTSSQPGEGKSTTTVNTGISLAMLGAKVLIIDADMRRPTIHKSLNVDPSHGLS